MPKRIKVGFLYIGGRHQVAHSAPVAAELALRGRVEVRAFAATQAEVDCFDAIARQCGCPDLVATRFRRPPLISSLIAGFPAVSALKVPIVVANLPHLARCNALVTTERTSSFLGRIPGWPPQMVHIPHGAGDRAVGFESRLSRFDHVITAGSKDRSRIISSGLQPAERVTAAGAVKLGHVLGNTPTPTLGLDTSRRTILYNPHFSKKLGSWPNAERVWNAVATRPDWNLIIAPHIRLADRLSPEERSRWERRAVPGRIIVDFGSERSIDMSYTRAADLYLGDVSSQVYEFIAEPRPCVFLNDGAAIWQDNHDYLHWTMGEVITRDDDLRQAVDAAFLNHGAFASRQEAAVKAALGDIENAAALAADKIEQLCLER
ncbi:glycosyl transferase [Pacificimonas sp. ICDLI1SI03]